MFRKARSGECVPRQRLANLRRSGVYRQSALGQVLAVCSGGAARRLAEARLPAIAAPMAACSPSSSTESREFWRPGRKASAQWDLFPRSPSTGPLAAPLVPLGPFPGSDGALGHIRRSRPGSVGIDA